jgi:hypothetical protein
MNDFDGCRRSCRNSGTHSFVHGDCEQGIPPEPVITLLRHDGDGHIVTLTYTVRELADVITPALRNVRIALGPNSLAALESGHTLTLSGGEIDSLALEAAHALIHGSSFT